MSLLQTIEHGDQNARLACSATKQLYFRNGSDPKYKELVRQRPTQACIEILIQTFFSDINWQYDIGFASLKIF